MLNKLSIEQRQKLEEALLNAFDLDNFSRMLKLQLGITLGHEVSLDKGFKFIVTNIVEIACMGGWLEKLLISAKKYNNENFLLNKLNQDLAVIDSPNVALVQPQIEEVNKIPSEGLLEKVINKRAPSLKFNNFTQGLYKLGIQICRIEIPEGVAQGTGWLVGPDIILTAYHVIEKVYNNSSGYTSEDITCRFDYTDATGDMNTQSGRTCRLADSWLIDYSKYALADEGLSQVEPSDNELDYALLRLSEEVSNDVVGQNNKRDWIQVTDNPTVMMESSDLMLILQHPQGKPLELAYGKVLRYNSNANRLRYDTNTDNGSSGAPCFDISLKPFGLHHASGPANNLAYNQCIPLRNIIRRMKEKKIPAFWINENLNKL